MNKAIRDAEREELKKRLVLLGEDANRKRAAAINEIARIRDGASMNVRGASKGSIVITVSVVGLAIWALDKTLGKTIEKAWTNSNMHKELVGFLSTRVFKKRDAIARQLEATQSKKRFTQRIEKPSNRPELEVIIAPTDKSRALPPPSEHFEEKTN